MAYTRKAKVHNGDDFFNCQGLIQYLTEQLGWYIGMDTQRYIVMVHDLYPDYSIYIYDNFCELYLKSDQIGMKDFECMVVVKNCDPEKTAQIIFTYIE